MQDFELRKKYIFVRVNFSGYIGHTWNSLEISVISTVLREKVCALIKKINKKWRKRYLVTDKKIVKEDTKIPK